MPAILQSLGAALIFASIWLRLCDRNNEFIGKTLGAGAVLFLIGGLMSVPLSAPRVANPTSIEKGNGHGHPM